ncbi:MULTISPECIES: nicotinamide riboside transporter PnuC [Listeria]|uniref:nicotinamide riboside transporter PnuC n=1 Tax=Listeria TaxID=1637 RepID=UPI000B58B8A4|nr:MULTISPECIES: nicotinamide riboside transporter PnuC [Listeria]
MIEALKKELFYGWTTFEKIWITIFLAVQIVVYILYPDSVIGLIAGISGILCVVFVGKGKISNYFFGLINVLAYAWVSYTFKLYGEVQLQLILYLPVQIVGFIMWKRHYSAKHAINKAKVKEVEAKSLTLVQWLICIVLVAVLTILYSIYLRSIGSALPGWDGATTIISVVAQILMILRFREQWLLWIVVNILTITLWVLMLSHSGETNMSVLVMYIMYLFNSVYSWYNWTKMVRSNKE